MSDQSARDPAGFAPSRVSSDAETEPAQDQRSGTGERLDQGVDQGVDQGIDQGVDERIDARVDDAAAAALARARATAKGRGLRPGMKPIRRRRPGVPETPRSKDGRDPKLLGDQMDRLLVDRGWRVDVAVGSVMGRWPDIVGAEVAQHCAPVTFEAGVLTVRADSTAWATQIRLLTSSILGRLEGEVGKGTVAELRVVGPSAPSWSRGPRRSQGPGPRDTYG